MDTGSLMDIPEVSIMGRITYKDVFALVGNFVSLDISANSTGWLKQVDGVRTTGTFKITGDRDDLLACRRQFRSFLLELYGSDTFEYTFVEDVIGSINFKTANLLYQLNPMVDDLQADNLLVAGKIIREDNNKWKSNLYACAGYTSAVKKNKEVKLMIRQAMELLGYGDEGEPLVEDQWDAAGLAVGVIHKLKIKGTTARPKKLHTDVSSGYNIRQFGDELSALEYGEERRRPVYSVDFTEKARDLRYHFKRLIEEVGEEYTFVITIESRKLGILALKLRLDTEEELTHLVVYRK